jgi:hypothetical protein
MLIAAAVMFILGAVLLLLLGPYPDFGRVTEEEPPATS